jgi:maltooligosyltrehalose trehalohydrolase
MHTALKTALRRRTVGVEVQQGRAPHARVWAPACSSVDVVIDAGGRRWRLGAEPDGHFGGELEGAAVGDRYWFELDGRLRRPDPASRYQPEGPHGPSQIVDPAAFAWTDAGWAGVRPEGQVVYEMHVGTFTSEGTWSAAGAHLESLADLGITIIEMMPVADFAGRHGWGYDGVNLYAPTHLYGTPDDLRAFVDRAHGLKLAVILDVVYNHVGPDGNYLAEFSADYFTDRYTNDWGQAINFETSAPARAFFVENAGYWIDEFHFDGLRLDATQDVRDASSEHVVAEMIRTARRAAGSRSIYVVAENEPQDTAFVHDPSRGGHGGDALWNDDYHHTALVALTGRREAYYLDYNGSPQEFVSAARYGYLYQGQWYAWQRKRRGTPALDLPPKAFVAYLENHDQVANTPFGRRLHQVAAPACLRALTALTLLGPATPMLFQGQEFAATAPFLYFADHKAELRAPVSSGRREFLSQFPSVTDPDVLAALASPVDMKTFLRCKLDHGERERHSQWYALHRDLIHLRRSDPVILRAADRRPDGAVIGHDAFMLRYIGDEDGDRLLVVNLGCDIDLSPVPEPLLAPPWGCRWDVLWSSEAPRYGGSGTPPIRPHSHLHVPGAAAVLLRSQPGGIHEAGPDHEDA